MIDFVEVVREATDIARATEPFASLIASVLAIFALLNGNKREGTVQVFMPHRIYIGMLDEPAAHPDSIPAIIDDHADRDDDRRGDMTRKDGQWLTVEELHDPKAVGHAILLKTGRQTHSHPWINKCAPQPAAQARLSGKVCQFIGSSPGPAGLNDLLVGARVYRWEQVLLHSSTRYFRSESDATGARKQDGLVSVIPTHSEVHPVAGAKHLDDVAFAGRPPRPLGLNDYPISDFSLRHSWASLKCRPHLKHAASARLDQGGRVWPLVNVLTFMLALSMASTMSVVLAPDQDHNPSNES
jgi:hypothetical protein